MVDSGPRASSENDDVAAVLDRLRAEVRARRLGQRQAEISPLGQDLQRSLDEIELHRVVSAHWPLIGTTLPQRAVALLNKLVRRYLRWYINPIVEQQNAYNDAVARALRLLAEAYADLVDQIAERRTTGNRPPTIDDQRQEMEDGGLRSDNRQPRIDAFQFSSDDIMARVRKQALSEPPAHFPDLELRALEPQLQLREQVNAHWPLPAVTLPQRAVALLNKLVRRYLRWYINPIVEQQNGANTAITAGLLTLIRLDAERRAQVASLRAAKAKGKR
jgi:predicted nucleic acid-binding protein